MNFVLSFIVNAISNAVIGVPVVITKISVGSWVGGFSGLGVSYAGHCSSDFSCDPFIIDGYRYNESDGKWYSNPPRPDIGEYTWNGEAPTEKQQWLTEIRNGVIQHFISRENPLQDIQSKFGQASTIPSPIVLDLDGDGIESVGVQAGLYFDHAGDGFAEQTGWIGRDDGFLVRDLNGNGSIDTGAELFGSETLLANGQKAANGFEALKELDSNHDGNVDAADTAYASLRIWKDGNSNGYTDTGELKTKGVRDI